MRNRSVSFKFVTDQLLIEMRRDVFQAIADPVRREIIGLLAKETLTVNAVAEQFDMTRPAISKHLKILNECGVINITKSGRERYCEIQARNLVPAFMWLDQFKNLWEDRFDALEEYLIQLQTNNKTMSMSTMDAAKDRTLTLERTFSAPLKLVWEAWSNPDHIAKWWGPKGMEVEVLEHDFKEGGNWKYKMAMPNGAEFITEGQYSEISPMEKIVSSADFKPMTEGVTMVMLFTAKGDKTEFTFHVIHPTAEYCKQQEEMGFYNGWGSVFDNLAAYVQEL